VETPITYALDEVVISQWLMHNVWGWYSEYLCIRYSVDISITCAQVI